MFFTSQNLSALTLDQITRKAPAVFATAAHERTSDRYLFIPTQTIVERLMENGWSVVSAIQTRSRVDVSAFTSKHALMLCRSENLGRDFNKGDVMPLLKIENSHNGLSSFSIQAGLFRKACANGLTVPDTMLFAPRVKHTTSIDRETVEASFKIIQDFPTLMEKVNVMKSIELSQDERRIFAESAARIVYDAEQVERMQKMGGRYDLASQLLSARRYDDRGSDLWTVSNVIQENAIRGGVKLVGTTNKISRSRAVSSIDKDSKINQELMVLAAKMAELRGQKIA